MLFKSECKCYAGSFFKTKSLPGKKMKICFPLANPAWLRYGIELGLRADYFQFPPNVEQLTVKLQCKRKGDKFREWSAAHTDYGGRGKVLLKKSWSVVSEPLLLICRLLSERCTWFRLYCPQSLLCFVPQEKFLIVKLARLIAPLNHTKYYLLHLLTMDHIIS